MARLQINIRSLFVPLAVAVVVWNISYYYYSFNTNKSESTDSSTSSSTDLFEKINVNQKDGTLQTINPKEDLFRKWQDGRLARIANPMTIKELRQNVYISDFSYRHRSEINYFSDLPVSFYQPVPYYAAAEIARRYKATYIIDMGCGKSYKLALLHPEFKTIGIDFKENINFSINKYPHLQFKEINMESTDLKNSKCHVDIDVSILENSVVLSSDVIEHISNPMPCYIELLKHFARHAKAVIVSTQDREIAYVPPVFTHGMPHNAGHIREWKIDELETLFVDSGMVPVIGGYGCAIYLLCNDDFLPNYHSRYNQIITFMNTKIGEKWVTGKIPPISGKLLAFILVHEETPFQYVIENVYHLLHHGATAIKVIIKNKKNNNVITSYETIVRHIHYIRESRPTVTVESYNEGSMLEHLSKLVAKTDSQDWVLITDAHEYVMPPRDPALEGVTIKQQLSLVEHENFNAVGVTTIFLQDSSMTKYTNLQKMIWFKIFGVGPWNKGPDPTKMDFKVHIPIMDHKVRIFRGGKSELKWETMQTNLGSTIVTGVNFPTRNVYPYFMYAQRAHVRSKPDFSIMSPAISEPRMQQLAAYSFKLGYMLTKNADYIQLKTYPY